MVHWLHPEPAQQNTVAYDRDPSHQEMEAESSEIQGPHEFKTSLDYVKPCLNLWGGMFGFRAFPIWSSY